MTAIERDEGLVRQAVGAEIARRRAASGIGVDALAKAADVDTSQMSKVLRGEAGLSLYSVCRVAAALGCQPGDLMPSSHAPRLSRAKAPRKPKSSAA